MSPNTTLRVARLVAGLWAAFWTFFCIASALGEHEGPIGGLMHLLPAAVMIASSYAARRRPGWGGALLVAEGIFVASGIWVRPSAMLFLMLGLPPIVAGGLFLAGASRVDPPGHSTA